MFKKLFLRFSLGWWILKQKFKKEEKENYWQDEWPYEVAVHTFGIESF